MSAGAAPGVAVVTGGASGIGAAVVARLRAGGTAVVVADRAPAAGEEPVDVTDGASVHALAERVAQAHGRLDLLVHCAGAVAVGSVDTAAGTAEEDWHRAFAVNVTGVWTVSRALLPLMGEGGAIVVVSSAAGVRPIPEMAAYVASKSAAVGLSRSMALDLAPRGIRVNCVCPGLVDTPLARAAQERRSPSERGRVDERRGYLIGRAGTAEEIAEAVVLAGTNGYLTGATLAVDGGRSLH
ncbi:SDR family oxidoreductase [Streptomyces sp. DASNCL29]|uniref:SDR family NAD(P)-dependent oxidoreductase n=1 Tax=Streptomyces sp. DASNCL29 TaxID=2583819 RepID=UPI00110F82FA|nr:SDR family oxidoreductase [Streptomyces sp. DASNCL29]TMU99810.1 SDR family oxidoreductase [Streptomyces sp. DASNCL29]